MTQRPTLREAYGMLDMKGTDRTEERRAQFLDIHYEGKPFGDHRLRMRSSDPSESRLSKEFGEAISFGHLAAGAGIYDQIADIVNAVPPEPDLIVTMTDGSEVYVEVAEVTEERSARASNTMSTINKHIANRHETDPTFAATSQGRYLDFRFPSVPASRDTQAVADEMAAVLYDTDFATIQRCTFLKPSETVAPILNRLGVRYWVEVGVSPVFSAQLDANSFDPDDAADDLDARLADKMNKTYAKSRPIWLALVLNDRSHVPLLSMEAIRRRLPSTIGQFDRVIFGTMEDAQIFTTIGEADPSTGVDTAKGSEKTNELLKARIEPPSFQDQLEQNPALKEAYDTAVAEGLPILD